jgi:hypothetical protein
MILLAYGAFLGICLLIQSAFYLWRGTAAPFFWVSPRSRQLSGLDRFMHGLVCLAAGAFPLIVVTPAVLRRIREAQMSHLQPAILLGVPGILFLVRPQIAIRWARHSNPNVSPEDTHSLVVARVVGALLLFGGLLFLTLP